MRERLPPPAVAEGCFRPGHGSAVRLRSSRLRPVGHASQSCTDQRARWPAVRIGFGTQLVRRWNDTVGHDDVILHLGARAKCSRLRSPSTRELSDSDGVSERDGLACGAGVGDLSIRGLPDVPAGVDHQNAISKIDLA